MSALVEKFIGKFELYRFCLPKQHRAIFDKIISNSDDKTLSTVPGGFDAVVLNQLIDFEQRLKALEDKDMDKIDDYEQGI